MAKELAGTAGVALPAEPVVMEEAAERIVMASQWKLMWLKFRKHRLALVSLIVIILLYIVAFFAGFVAPKTGDPADLQTPNYTPPGYTHQTEYVNAPPMPIYWFDNGAFAPYVYAYKKTRDQHTLEETFTVDTTNKIRLGFFVHGDIYRVGLHGIPIGFISAIRFTSDVHLFGPINPTDP